MVVSLCLGMKRSSTCTDLMAMDGNTIITDSTQETSKKRISSVVFGWDHYRSHEDTIDLKDESQTWRNQKRRRKNGASKKVLIHRKNSSYDSIQGPSLTSISEPQTAFELTKLSSSPNDSLLSASSKAISDDSSEENMLVLNLREITHELASTFM